MSATLPALLGPWTITVHALDQYVAIRSGAGERGVDRDAARLALEAMAEDCRQAARVGTKHPKLMRGRTDLYQFRGPRPHRLALVVSTSPDPSGRPQLVDVQVGFAGKGRRR